MLFLGSYTPCTLLLRWGLLMRAETHWLGHKNWSLSARALPVCGSQELKLQAHTITSGFVYEF